MLSGIFWNVQISLFFKNSLDTWGRGAALILTYIIVLKSIQAKYLNKCLKTKSETDLIPWGPSLQIKIIISFISNTIHDT